MGLYGELRSPPIFWPFLLFLHARANVRAGRQADGLQAIDASIEIFGVDASASILPELQLVKGDLIAIGGSDAEHGAADAEAWYQRAFDRSVELGARMSQVRAATRLARLRVAAGNPRAAASLLGPVYDSFTEGFDTADLRDAREVLQAAGRR